MLISMAKKCWARALTATVTRRNGWLRLAEHFEDGRPPVVLEMIEWSPRIGKRWIHSCGHLGPKRRPYGAASCPSCNNYWSAGGFWIEERRPYRGRFVRVLDATREPLAAMPHSDLALEGFPELELIQFWRLYLGLVPGAGAADVVGRAKNHWVTRIKYEHLEGRP